MEELRVIFKSIRDGDVDAVSELIGVTSKTVAGRIFVLFWRSGYKNRWTESDFLSKTFLEDTLSSVYSEVVLNVTKVCKSTNPAKYFYGIVRNVIKDCLANRSRELALFKKPTPAEDDGSMSVNESISIPADNVPRRVRARLLLEKIDDIIAGLDDPLKKDILHLKRQGYLPREILNVLSGFYGEEELNSENIYSKIRWAVDNLLKRLPKDDSDLF
jgi:hypothetical protein